MKNFGVEIIWQYYGPNDGELKECLFALLILLQALDDAGGGVCVGGGICLGKGTQIITEETLHPFDNYAKSHLE